MGLVTRQLISSIVLAKKPVTFFQSMALRGCLVVFNSIRNNVVRLLGDTCHISVHLKKLSKLVNFCAAFLILKMEDTQHFGRIMLY